MKRGVMELIFKSDRRRPHPSIPHFFKFDEGAEEKSLQVPSSGQKFTRPQGVPLWNLEIPVKSSSSNTDAVCCCLIMLS